MIEQRFFMCEKCGFRSAQKEEVLQCEKYHKLKDNLFRTLTFEVTEQHLALMKHFHVGWQRCEYGAPEINPKRPYGNSYVEGDVADILGMEPEAEEDGEKVLSEEQNSAIYILHLETKVALEIALQTGQFKTGKYVREHAYSALWHEEGDSHA